MKTVIGLGLTGLACVRYLTRCGIAVAVTDSRDDPPGLAILQQEFPDIPVAVGEFSTAFLENADELIVSPGVSIKHPLITRQIERGVKVSGDIELFAREVKKPVIAITGSNGKTTITTLVGLMIEAAGYNATLCGNIGNPVLDLLTEQSPDFYVMELSSFQLETTHSLFSTVAVITNMTPDHMDRYHNYDDYIAAKQRIYQHCQHAIVNADQPEIWQALPNLTPTFSFTLHPPAHDHQFGIIREQGHYYLAQGTKRLLKAEKMKLKGWHHLQNALIALAIGQTIGLPMPQMLATLTQFAGIAHRCQWVATKQGVSWYNDSKATNIGATIAAIKSLNMSHQGKIILIAGGDAKGADLSSLQQPVAEGIAHVMLFGQDASQIEKVLTGWVPITRVEDLSAAVAQAAKVAQSGDMVLLSPACASYDMFQNFEHRGNVFMQLVNELP